MNTHIKKIIIALLSGSLLLASTYSSAKQTEIGIAAIATDTRLLGKGEFVVNDTLNEGDSLKTGKKGNATVLFNDESMLTLGPNAHASIEVYEEGKNGKPGRSIIRVHKGQFRYFPGGILENGGAQFVAVGNKLLGKTGTPRSNNNRQNSNQDNRINKKPVPVKLSEGTPSETEDTNAKDKKHKSNIQLTESSEGTDSTGNEGGASGVIEGPPVSTNPRSSQAQYNGGGNVAANPDAPGSDTDNTDETPAGPGGGFAGEVGGGGELLASSEAPEDEEPSGRGEVAAPAETAVESSESSGSGDSSDSSSDSTDESSSSTETSDSSSSTVSTDSDTTPVPAAEAFEVADIGSGGAAPTGGTGGGNQDCAEPPCGGGGGFGSTGGDSGQGPGGLLGGLIGGGGRDPGGLIGGGRDPGGIGGGDSPRVGLGGIGGFVDNGITGNVVEGAGRFRGDVDVYGSAGSEIGFLGSATSTQDIALRLSDQASLGASGIGATGFSSGLNRGSLLGMDASSRGNLSSIDTLQIASPGATNLGRIGLGSGVATNLGAGIASSLGADIGTSVGANIGTTSTRVGANVSTRINTNINTRINTNIGRNIGNLGGVLRR